MSKRSVAFMLVGAALLTVAASAQQPPPPPAPENTDERPEYRVKALPKDTFKPSEKVTEDFPVAFPEDI